MVKTTVLRAGAMVKRSHGHFGRSHGQTGRRRPVFPDSAAGPYRVAV